MTRIAVKPEVIQWAIDRSGRLVDELRDRFPKIGEWLTGAIEPTLKQLDDFAQATSTPLGMLFLESPPEESLPIPLYRTTKDKSVRRPSVNLLDTIQSMQRRQNWMRDYLVDCGQPPLPFVRS